MHIPRKAGTHTEPPTQQTTVYRLSAEYLSHLQEITSSNPQQVHKHSPCDNRLAVSFQLFGFANSLMTRKSALLDSRETGPGTVKPKPK